MKDDITETLHVRVASLADWSSPAVGRSIGEVFDADAAIVPDRWGRQDPARKRLSSVGDLLEEWAPRFATDDNGLFLDGPRSSAWVGACPGTAGKAMRPFLRDRCWNEVEWTLDEKWLRDPTGGPETFGERFAQLCDAADAYYGSVDTDSFIRWTMMKTRQVRMPLLADLRSDPKHPYSSESYFVADVHWMNFFGPAFVDRWGRERFDHVGVRRHWVSNGGVVVWATAEPPELEQTSRVDGYGWKRSFYEHLDPNAFVHEGFTQGGPGEHVPSMDEHRAHLRKGPTPS